MPEWIGGMPKEEYDKLVEHIEQRPARMAELKRTIAEAKEKSARLEKELDNASWAYSLKGSIILTISLLLAALVAEWVIALQSTLMVYFGLLLWKLACFYGIAPLIEKLRGFKLFDPEEKAPDVTEATSVSDASSKLLTLPLEPGQVLTVCDEAYTGGYSDEDSERLSKSTKWIFSGRYWIMSVLCGLVLMTRFKNKGNTKTQHITITSDDPDEYFSELRVQEGSKFYITPADLVAYSDGIHIRAHWRLFSLTAWCMGQVRYYTLAGSGRVVVRSEGGITINRVTPGNSYICKKHSIISAEQGVRMHVRRTETLAPYLFGRSGLFDLRLHGNGAYRMRNAISTPHTLSERASHLFMESLGAFFGF